MISETTPPFVTHWVRTAGSPSSLGVGVSVGKGEEGASTSGDTAATLGIGSDTNGVGIEDSRLEMALVLRAGTGAVGAPIGPVALPRGALGPPKGAVGTGTVGELSLIHI